MFKGNSKYYFIFGLLLASLILYQYLAPHPLNWKRTFLSNHKIPYGTNALYQLVETGFISKDVEKEDQSVYSFLTMREHTPFPSSYLFIDETLSFDQLDTRELMKYVSDGNTVFLAAGMYQGKLADTFNIKTDLGILNFIVLKNDSATQGGNTVINFTNPVLKARNDYVYNGKLQHNYFTSFDTSRTTILAQDVKKKVNLIAIQHGKGKFIISSLPDAFSNYWIVNERNREYAYTALSYAGNPILHWDEHYKSSRQKNDSPMGYVLANDSLYAAWLLTILSLLIFMIFEAKRNQRMIPVIEPLKNTTLEFVEVVGSVYYSSKNHKTIAGEKISVFLDFIRTRFQVSTRLYDDNFYKRVSLLSGISREEIEHLFHTIDKISFKESISEEELINLNSLIENFYKTNKR